ncbi:MAG: MBL fold metallo-hydrolase [Clostridiales bacterium]|jgi:competence protein ComEC|nr:MBL fold metallo-hydrolase [Clostridiales bacterium]
MKKPTKNNGSTITKKSGLTIILCLILIAVLAGCRLWPFKPNDTTGGNGTSGNGQEQGEGNGEGQGEGEGHGEGHDIVSGDLSIHFLELGNKFTGDSVYIKSGDTDILIDAGSVNKSASTITNYLDGYITDGKIEYVIATHAHEDHIAGFYSNGSGSGKVVGIFEAYEVDTIIDFPLTNNTSPSATSVLGRYIAARDAEIALGAKHYTAIECYQNIGGASGSYEIGDGIELEILYNYYYDHTQSSGENNYSVCIMINQGDNHYLFTGDLEKSGEDKLVDYYASYGGLPHCVLYKAGHHGSSTSSNVKLLAAITPEYVCICTCAGSSEYTAIDHNQFPTQDFIDRISVYTDKVYVTTLVTDYSAGQFESMNGNIVFSVIDLQISIACSNNDTILKNTAWFIDHRDMPPTWV